MAERMKAKRPAMVVALASALALALCAPASAFAADPVPPEATTDKTVTTSGGTQESQITGTVKATTITVTVPTQVAFYIDPGATQSTTANWASSKKIGQYTNPTNFTITNRSAVDVFGYVSKVASPHVKLVDDKTALAKPGGVAPSAENKSRIGVMVGICGTSESLDFATKKDWLTESVADTAAARYFAFNEAGQGKLTAATDKAGSSATVSPGGAYTMTVRGAVFDGGWSQDENFLVTPTFKIVTDPASLA